ncbi:MAG TPA: hypothetical protein VJ397_05575 [Thermoplasmata archaeon]|nr:hypothetical protein [Thermoplasmata archaeon]
MPAATVLGLSPYLWIMIIFLVLLVVVLVVGDFGGADHDVDVGGDISGLSPLSLPVVAMFGTTFGGIGALLDTLDLPTVAVVGVAVLFAAALAGGMYFAMVRLFVKGQVSSDVVPAELVGQEANVLIPISPGQSGQVLVITAARGRTLLSAVSSEEIKTDEAVVIEGVVGDAVRVRKVKVS